MRKNEDNSYPELISPGPIFKKFFILSNKNKITNDYYFDSNNVVFKKNFSFRKSKANIILEIGTRKLWLCSSRFASDL